MLEGGEPECRVVVVAFNLAYGIREVLLCWWVEVALKFRPADRGEEEDEGRDDVASQFLSLSVTIGRFVGTIS